MAFLPAQKLDTGISELQISNLQAPWLTEGPPYMHYQLRSPILPKSLHGNAAVLAWHLVHSRGFLGGREYMFSSSLPSQVKSDSHQQYCWCKFAGTSEGESDLGKGLGFSDHHCFQTLLLQVPNPPISPPWLLPSTHHHPPIPTLPYLRWQAHPVCCHADSAEAWLHFLACYSPMAYLGLGLGWKSIQFSIIESPYEIRAFICTTS